MNKIKEKLTGSSSGNKLEKSYDSSSSGTSHLQHPISSSSPVGTAVSGGSDGYGSQPGTYSSESDKYGSNSGTYGTQSDSYGSKTGTYSNQPGTYGDQSSSTYNSQPSGYSSSGTDRMPGGYVSENEPTSTSTSTSTAPRDKYDSATGPRQPYDPYSRKGQATAAGYTTGSSTTQSKDYGQTTAEDPSIARSKYGGVTNQTEPQRYTSGSQTTSEVPYRTQQQPTSEHHYGRDAAMAGGVGAVGAGGLAAYEGGSYPQTSTSSNPQDVSYMKGTSGGTQYEPETRRSVEDPSRTGVQSSTGTSAPGESAGLAQAKKMGGAYEAGYKDGYRDAMEHAQSQKF